MKRAETLRSGAIHAPKRIHLVYPHGPQVSAPDSIGRHLGQRLEAWYEVAYHDWHERGVIKPEPGDVLLGHPHPAQGTIFRRSARERGWARVLMMAPYNHDLRQVAFEDSVIRDCDLFLAITGPYWFGSVAASPCAHWRPKMIHLDLAVDRSEFSALAREFRPAGERTFAYIGGTAAVKNTRYLTALARRMPGVRFAWIGTGERKIDGLEPFGQVDFSTAEGRAIVAQFDFLVTLGKADANPTTILESMSWGLLPVCTPQSGYAGIPTITNVPLDDPDEAAAVLARLNTLPEQRLLAMQAENWRLLDQHYNWERFADQVIAAIESTASPTLNPESCSRRIMFAYSTQRAPHGPLRTGLRRVFRKPGRLFRRGASAVRRMRRRPGVGHTPKGTQR
jgi:glycosyltransferase involved in cell wall biosynthesis